jgi:hypothetical protein
MRLTKRNMRIRKNTLSRDFPSRPFCKSWTWLKNKEDIMAILSALGMLILGGFIWLMFCVSERLRDYEYKLKDEKQSRIERKKEMLRKLRGKDF